MAGRRPSCPSLSDKQGKAGIQTFLQYRAAADPFVDGDESDDWKLAYLIHRSGSPELVYDTELINDPAAQEYRSKFVPRPEGDRPL